MDIRKVPDVQPQCQENTEQNEHRSFKTAPADLFPLQQEQQRNKDKVHGYDTRHGRCIHVPRSQQKKCIESEQFGRQQKAQQHLPPVNTEELPEKKHQRKEEANQICDKQKRKTGYGRRNSLQEYILQRRKKSNCQKG